MKEFTILTDSCIDLTNEMALEMDLEVIPLSTSIDGVEYFNYLDERDITFKAFYQALREHKKPVTSQANVQGFMNKMTKILESGKDVLSISFSSALSGTYQASVLAAEELREQFPQQNIVTIDSSCASMGQGLLVTYVSKMQKEGKSMEYVANWIEDNKHKVCHLFTVGDLNHLRRGGRLSAGKAFIGTILRVKPILHVSMEGKLVPLDKTKGRKSALEKLTQRLVDTIEKPEDQMIYISHGDCIEDAFLLQQMISEKVKVKEFKINFIGPVIGSHAGIDTLAVFYMGNDRFV